MASIVGVSASFGIALGLAYLVGNLVEKYDLVERWQCWKGSLMKQLLKGVSNMRNYLCYGLSMSSLNTMKSFEHYDLNGDGVITKEEYMRREYMQKISPLHSKETTHS